MSYDLTKTSTGMIVILLAGGVILGANPLVAALEEAGAGNQPGEVTNVTATPTPTSTTTPTPTATLTATQSPATSSEQFSSSPMTVIVEVENNGTQIMVGLQNVPSNVASARVEGAVIRDHLDVDDDYPMATGTVARPTTITIIATYNNGTRQIVTQRQIPDTDTN